MDPLKRSVGKGGQRRDTFDKAEEGAEGKHGANLVSRNFRNRNTDFPLSELISFRTSDFEDRATIREFDIGAS